ncbi:uncharacterized protein LOC104901373 isoform X2 [Beta vulgaris subsp. vulgaris]|uniref:uncharacterized protein LOC104901373 isoform X2 n=1 Tax=Beta vulgaris subsp. vulgaris TaxID=3555 RepID=UPI0025472ADC|nr:uncharacterized protein LOC104901373 isoform X2 [Beta vulgaris subsp. vulgaris]
MKSSQVRQGVVHWAKGGQKQRLVKKMTTIEQARIHHYHSFNLYSSIPTPTSTFFPLKLHFFKTHNSLQINSSLQTNHSNSNSNQQSPLFPPTNPISSSLHPNNLKPLPKTTGATASDPELRAVLQLATNSELFEIERILFGSSYMSPLLKSINSPVEFDRFMIEEDFEEREHFIEVLESRFLYLAADARSTLRGWRPSYRKVLLDVRKELKIPCSTKLSAEDLEVEIFIHLVGECSRDWDNAAAIKVGTAELCSMLLKGGQLISMLKISELVTTRLSGKMLYEAAKRKLENGVATKGLSAAASRYLGFRSLATFIGPISPEELQRNRCKCGSMRSTPTSHTKENEGF